MFHVTPSGIHHIYAPMPGSSFRRFQKKCPNPQKHPNAVNGSYGMYKLVEAEQAVAAFYKGEESPGSAGYGAG